MNGKRDENLFFIAALSVSLLLHITALWLGRDVVVGDSALAPDSFLAVINVALAPAAVQKKVAASETPAPRPVKAPPPQMPEKPFSPNEESVTEEVAAEPGVAADSEALTPSEPVEAGRQSDATVRDVYLAQVLAHIESHKYYPASARRRGIEGNVEVRFMLDAEGGVSRLDVNGRNALLEEAAREAIRSAMPLPSAPSATGFPLTVSYQMIFKLH